MLYTISLGGAKLNEEGMRYVLDTSNGWFYNAYAYGGCVFNENLPIDTQIADLKELWMSMVEYPNAFCYGWKYNEGRICDHGDSAFGGGEMSNTMFWIENRVDISGKVVDEKGNGLDNCLVMYKSTVNPSNDFVVFTDLSGNYRLLVPEGDYGIVNIYNNLKWWDDSSFDSIGGTFNIENAYTQVLPTVVLTSDFTKVVLQIADSSQNAYYAGTTFKFVADNAFDEQGNSMQFESSILDDMQVIYLPLGLTGTFYADSAYYVFEPVKIENPFVEAEETITFKASTEKKGPNAKIYGTLKYSDDGAKTIKPLSNATVSFSEPEGTKVVKTNQDGYFEAPVYAFTFYEFDVNLDTMYFHFALPCALAYNQSLDVSKTFYIEPQVQDFDDSVNSLAIADEASADNLPDEAQPALEFYFPVINYIYKNCLRSVFTFLFA